MILPEQLGGTAPTLPPIAFDTETRYNPDDYTVDDVGNENYTNDSRFECYLISCYSEDFSFSGHPRDLPWEKLRGRVLLSHNAGFDQAVLRRMIELGQAPAWVWPQEWHCTANLCVFLGRPRALKSVVKVEYGVVLDKAVRDKDMIDMTGAKLDLLGPEVKAKFYEYALNDAKYCYRLWVDFAHLWPLTERKISAHTYALGVRGLPINLDLLQRQIDLMERAVFENRNHIPWVQEDADAPVLSLKRLGHYCREVGIEAPVSLAKDSDECVEWEDKYGDKYPVVARMRSYRRSNAYLAKLKAIKGRCRADGRCSTVLMYFGAGTGRFAGRGGVNWQNLIKEPICFDADWNIVAEKDAFLDRVCHMRHLISAPAGRTLSIADYAQIEARVTPWLAGDEETIARVRTGTSVYQVHAEVSMGWIGGDLKKSDKKLYALAKARVLGLGFQCGFFKFVSFSKKSLRDIPGMFEQIFEAPQDEDTVQRFHDYLIATDRKKTYLTVWETLPQNVRLQWVNSWLQVQDFRSKNPKIVANLWDCLQQAARRSIGGNFELELPSGRSIVYFDVHSNGREVAAKGVKGGTFTKVYGGLLTENLVQATARDVMIEAVLRLEGAGYHVILHVHDEIVVELSAENTEFHRAEINRIMCVVPDWAEGLPLGVESELSTYYKK